MNFRLGNYAERREKIEIATFICLADMLRIKRAVTARVAGRRLFPDGTTTSDFFLGNVQMDAACGDIDLEGVARLDKGQRAADEAFGRNVKNACAVAGTAH